MPDNFYTIDPSGEAATTSGYNYEGVPCYVYNNPEPGTISFYR